MFTGKSEGDFSHLLDYFANNLGSHIKPHQNPADFILDAVGAGISKPSIPGEDAQVNQQSLNDKLKSD